MPPDFALKMKFPIENITLGLYDIWKQIGYDKKVSNLINEAIHLFIWLNTQYQQFPIPGCLSCCIKDLFIQQSCKGHMSWTWLVHAIQLYPCLFQSPGSRLNFHCTKVQGHKTIEFHSKLLCCVSQLPTWRMSFKPFKKRHIYSK